MSSVKKLTAIILLFALTLSFAVMPVHATSATDGDELDSYMLRILASIAHEKEFYGLEDVDLDNVTIGKEIPAYIVTNEVLEASDIRFFPVLHNGQIKSLFLATLLPEGEWYVQLGTELVQELAPYTENNEFALIYDDSGAHVYVDSEITQIAVSEVPKKSTVKSAQPELLTANSISSLRASALEDIATTGLVADKELRVSDLPVIQNNSRAVVERTLNVPKIKQPSGTNICWAIAITSIANYIFNRNLSYSTIVNQFNNGNDTALATSTVISKFNNYYDANYKYVASGKPTMTTILNILAKEKPVYGDFTSSSGAHAVVIRGANSSNRTFSVMNPTPTTSGYTSGTVSSSNVWKFVSAHSSKTYTLRYYGKYNG